MFGFYVPPTAKVIRRQDLGLKSHPKDRRGPGSNSGTLVYKADSLTSFLYIFEIQNFKSLSISSSCTAWFVSDLVRNHIVGFLVLRLIFDLLLLCLGFTSHQQLRSYGDRTSV